MHRAHAPGAVAVVAALAILVASALLRADRARRAREGAARARFAMELGAVFARPPHRLTRAELAFFLAHRVR
jgi:hypothetical protein